MHELCEEYFATKNNKKYAFPTISNVMDSGLNLIFSIQTQYSAFLLKPGTSCSRTQPRKLIDRLKKSFHFNITFSRK